ncbi:MAG TPA: YceH family protein [Thermoleophilaceae bacterium]|nr:YceH family protein [Thermoleophilaceae bacterium]
MEPDAVEIRVLGCLIEKQRTTPDVYPLTLNALRLACNQSTNRDPVVDYDDSTIRAALERLGRRKWTTLASWSNRRAMKYRHTLDSALGLSEPELAVLCVLMLRGPQTPGELKQRTERLHAFARLDGIEDTLRGLIDRELVAQLPRRPGQREERYRHVLGGGAEEEPAATPAPSAAREQEPAPASDGLERRVARLEDELASLRADLRALRGDLGAAE